LIALTDALNVIVGWFHSTNCIERAGEQIGPGTPEFYADLCFCSLRLSTTFLLYWI